MYKFLIIIIFPLFVFAKSAVLSNILDGDSAVFKDGDKNIICHLGDLDALEMRINKKLEEEMKKCSFSKENFITAGQESFNHAQKLLKIGATYEYTVTRVLPNKNLVCSLKIPKGLHVEIHPYFDQLMVSDGFALPYVIYSSKEDKNTLLKIAKGAKVQEKGLWKTHPDLMQCLVEHRYSLRSLR